MKKQNIHISQGSKFYLNSRIGYVLVLIIFFQCTFSVQLHFLGNYAGISNGIALLMTQNHDNHEMPFNAADNEAEMPVSDIDELITTSFSNNYALYYTNREMAYLLPIGLSLKTISIPTPPPDLSI